MKKNLTLLASIAMFFAAVTQVSAHAVVKPNQAGIGAFQVFTLGVPSEKPQATTAVRLLLPGGLNFITPNVKAGWSIQVKTQATGNKVKNDDGNMVDEQKPVEIDWTGGSIPAGQRDEFNFQAQVPSLPITLQWKVYQTYADGSVVNWDQDGTTMAKGSDGKMDMSKGGPYSTTNVVNDLAGSGAPVSGVHAPARSDVSPIEGNSTQLPLVISVIALVIAVWSVIKKK